MVNTRKVMTDTGWLLIAIGLIRCACDLIRTGLDLGRSARWWP